MIEGCRDLRKSFVQKGTCLQRIGFPEPNHVAFEKRMVLSSSPEASLSNDTYIFPFSWVLTSTHSIKNDTSVSWSIAVFGVMFFFVLHKTTKCRNFFRFARFPSVHLYVVFVPNFSSGSNLCSLKKNILRGFSTNKNYLCLFILYAIFLVSDQYWHIHVWHVAL